MGFIDELKFAKSYAVNIRNRQKAQGFIPRDLGVLRRAQKAGRVHIGRGTYGVPGLHMTMLDNTQLFIGNYSSTGPLCYLVAGVVFRYSATQFRNVCSFTPISCSRRDRTRLLETSVSLVR